MGDAAALAGLSVRALPDVLGLERFTRIADLGGGTGLVLAHLLEAAPHASGLLYDVESAIEGAHTFLATRGLSDRVALECGDLFAHVPAGADAYLLKNVLHDHSDERCGRLLDLLRATFRPPPGCSSSTP
jgi:hypothetical protein